MLDKIDLNELKKYKTVIIDESHGFRNETTQMYEELFKLCKGKKVILVSATPLNNTPIDILSQIKLFQNTRKSTLPNPEVRDLESFFKGLQARLKGLDRQKDKEDYLKIVRDNANEIREKVLKYLMVRRTRKSIETYYADDLKDQNLSFPEVVDPKPVVYSFDKKLDDIFNQTLDLIINKFSYSRYTPLLYLKNQNQLSNLDKGSQRNMGNFMKGVLLKRLESSFFAFKKSISRFIKSYESFIGAFEEKKHVYFSKKHIHRILEYIDSDDDESLQKLIEEKKAREFNAKDFNKDFIVDLRKDLKTLKIINDLWKDINYDPKLEEFERRLSKDPVLLNNKLVVFTESRETAEYLEEKLSLTLKNQVRSFSSKSDESLLREIIDNFDARKKDSNTIRILITTDILAEGVNLHRSNTVINYDIPWNPTKMMQRVGRINRVDSKHDKIYTYNFFPAGPINENVKLTEAAEAKINAFIEMLGNDAKILTDEEIKTHDLFSKLTSRNILMQDEDEPEDAELKYLSLLRKIRDNDEKLYKKIKRLPKKSRTSRKVKEGKLSLITFFRKGKLRKIYRCWKGTEPAELDFAEAASLFECNINEKSANLDKEFYQLLERNKEIFDSVFDIQTMISGTGRSNEFKIIKKIKAIVNTEDFSQDDKDFLKDVVNLLADGAVAKATSKKIMKVIGKESNPSKILYAIKENITEEFFKENPTNSAQISGPKEVILSEYLVGDK